MKDPGAPRRVAQLVEALGAGGAELLAVDIAGALAQRGQESHLIVLESDGPFRARILPQVRFHDLRRHRRGGQVARIVHFLGTCLRLASLLRRERIDVLQTHLPKANFLGLVMARWRICHVHATVHNNREFDYGDHAGPLKRKLRRAGYRQMLNHCASVIAVSDEVRRALGAELGVGRDAMARISVVTNGTPVHPLPTAADRAAARAAWGVPEGGVLLVGVGRLTYQKNFEALLDALAPLAGDPGWCCVVAGEGELREDLTRQVERLGLGGRVRLAGLVGDMPGLLAAADVFCLVSRFEGLPLAMLEAMAAGLPVAAFSIAGVTDVVTHGAHAVLAPPGDVTGFRAGVRSLIADGELRRRLGAAGRQLVLERYAFPGVIDRLEAVYAGRAQACDKGSPATNAEMPADA